MLNISRNSFTDDTFNIAWNQVYFKHYQAGGSRGTVPLLPFLASRGALRGEVPLGVLICCA